MREGWDHLGRQWEGDGPHAVRRIGQPDEVQERQRSLLHIAERREELFTGAPVRNLDPKKVLPTQQYLWRSNHDAVSSAPADELPPVDVVKKGRQHFVLDGHHRWDVARATGRPLRARVIEYRPRS